MKWLRGAVAACGLGFVILATVHRSMADDPNRQRACDLDRTIRVRLKYLLSLPKDYDGQKAFPLLLFLHGVGERGEDLQALKVYGPPKMIESGKDLPFIVVSPLCPKDRWWEPLELTTLLDEIVEKYKVDQDRIYVTGLSMGGFGTWALAGSTPDRFSAIAPICGGGDPERAKWLAHIPVWIFHGAKDTTVPLERSEKMVAALKKNGGEVRFTVYPNAGHDAWTETYANPELYQWLLQQKRKPKVSEKPQP
jgi:predicted peptidase